MTRSSPKKTKPQTPSKTTPRFGTGLPWVASLLLLGLLLASFQTKRMVYSWMGRDCGFNKYPLDLTVDSVQAEWGYSTTGLYQARFTPEGTSPSILNYSPAGKPLNINSFKFPTGVSVRAPGRIAFAVNGKAGRFSCEVGVDASSDGSLSRGAVCRIMADGREILACPRLTISSSPYRVDVPVAGVKELILWADTTDLEDIGTNVDWVDLKFTP